MWFQWREQKDYISLIWGCGEFIGHLFVIVNMVFQIAGCVMVLIRRYVHVAVGMLFAVILIQVSGERGKGERKGSDSLVTLYIIFVIIF